MSYRSVFAVGVLLAASSAGAQAQNLINNGRFDTDLSGWEVRNQEDVTSVRSKEDADDASGSGSAVVTNTSERGSNSVFGLRQCVEISPGQTFRLSADLRSPGGQETTGEARIGGVYFEGAGCQGTFLGGPTLLFTGDQPSWGTVIQEHTAPSSARSLFVDLRSFKDQAGGAFEVLFDNLDLRPTGSGICIPDATSLCLNDGRFRLTASWRRANGEEGPGQGVQLTDDTGYFWFFNSANVEMVVKVLEACSQPTPRYWVFAGGLTNVEVELRVEDTDSGLSVTYRNPQRTPLEPIQDTDAFATCP